MSVDASAEHPLSATRRSPINLTWLIGQAICVAVALVPFLLPAIPVGTDIIKHLMVARVLADYRDPVLAYSQHFWVHWRPTPTSLGDLTLAGLVQVFEPIIAAKAYFVVYAAGLCVSGRFFLQRLGRPPHAALLLLPLVHSFFVFSGFLPFIGAIALYPLLLGILVGYRPSALKSLALACVLTAMFGFHLVGAAIGCFTVLMFAVDVERRNVRWLDALSVAPAGALIVYFQLTKPAEAGGALFHGPLGQIKAYLAYNIWTLSDGASMAALALLAALGAVAFADVVRKRVANARLLLLAVALVAIGLVMPYQMGSAFIIGSRTLPFAVIAAVGALQWNGLRLRAAAVVLSLFLVVSSTLNTERALAMQSDYRTFLSGMSSVREGSRVLPIVPNIGQGGSNYVYPFNGVEDLYQIYRGGSNPYVFADPFVPTGGNLLELKYHPTRATKHRHVPADYHGAFSVYDYVLCWECTADVMAVLSGEAPLVFRNGKLSIYGGSRSRTDTLPRGDAKK